jgi:hypothetical protein
MVIWGHGPARAPLCQWKHASREASSMRGTSREYSLIVSAEFNLSIRGTDCERANLC